MPVAIASHEARDLNGGVACEPQDPSNGLTVFELNQFGMNEMVVLESTIDMLAGPEGLTFDRDFVIEALSNIPLDVLREEAKRKVARLHELVDRSADDAPLGCGENRGHDSFNRSDQLQLGNLSEVQGIKAVLDIMSGSDGSVFPSDITAAILSNMRLEVLGVECHLQLSKLRNLS